MSQHEQDNNLKLANLSTGEQEDLVNAQDITTKERSKCFSLLGAKQVVKAILLGQLVSLLLCGTAVTSGVLQIHGVNIPTAQSFLNYVLLCHVFMIMLCCRKKGRPLHEVFRNWWWRYLLIAFVDVEANYLVVKAYAYTTVTSVQLLDCVTLISVMILSRLFFHAQYTLKHLGGVGLCLLGMIGLVLTDILVGKNDNAASNVALGDTLIIIGATLYGVSNICQEYVVRTYDMVEFLGMVGFFGSLINGAQCAILERNEILSIDLTSPEFVISLVIFVICLFLLYILMAVVIKMSSATAINLSILSADFYTLLFGLFLFNYKFNVLYFVAFVSIMAGLVIYFLVPTKAPDIENSSTSSTLDNVPTSEEPEDKCLTEIKDETICNDTASATL